MDKNTQLPAWLKAKSINYHIEETDKPTNKLMVLVVIGTIVSYIGLMVMQSAKTDPTTNNSDNAITPLPARDIGYPVYNGTQEKPAIVQSLSDRDLPQLEQYLKNIHNLSISAEDPAQKEDVCTKRSGKYTLQNMISPSRYVETQCMAQASYSLYINTKEIKYLELASYYYRRCLYLIDGQLLGRFKKPSGGNEQIRRRQDIVLSALSDIAKLSE